MLADNKQPGSGHKFLFFDSIRKPPLIMEGLEVLKKKKDLDLAQSHNQYK